MTLVPKTLESLKRVLFFNSKGESRLVWSTPVYFRWPSQDDSVTEIKGIDGIVFWKWCESESETCKYNIYRPTMQKPGLFWNCPVFARSIVFWGAIDIKGCDEYISVEGNRITAKKGYLLRLSGANFHEIVIFEL